MKRWRSVKMMMLALVALFLPAALMPALCCASISASSHHATPKLMACCERKAHAVSPATVQCAMHKTVIQAATHSCCCGPTPKSPQPSPDITLPAASTRNATAQAEQNRAVFGPQYLTTILISAPPVLSPLPQTSERNFEIISPLSSSDKSPPAPGRAPPVL